MNVGKFLILIVLVVTAFAFSCFHAYHNLVPAMKGLSNGDSIQTDTIKMDIVKKDSIKL